MPRNTQKKIHRFFSSRRQREKASRVVVHDTSSSLYFDVFCAVLVPSIFGILYAFLRIMDAFSVLYPLMHLGAFIVLFFWAASAYFGARGYWSHKAHFLFGTLVSGLVFFGACWGTQVSIPIKAWITAPPYARLPSTQMDTTAQQSYYKAVEGSVIHLSLHGPNIEPIVRFAGRKARIETIGSADFSTDILVPRVEKTEAVNLIVHDGWRRLVSLNIVVMPDMAPHIIMLEEPEVTLRKTMRFAYKATDDYGVEQVAVRIAPTSSMPGGNNDPVEIVLASPLLREFETASYADLTALPWVGVPVTVQLVATDGTGHKGWGEPKIITLPSRTFQNPFARALIEERQKFLAQPDAMRRDEAANVMAGVARQQSLYNGDVVVMMALRSGAVRLVLNDDSRTIEAVGDILWKSALRLEEGVVGQVRAELADAERDLSHALFREASIQDIRPYLFRVREVMDKYFEALEAEKARQPPALQEMDWPLATASEMLTPEDLHGRLTVVEDHLRAEEFDVAAERLAELQALIENLRTTPPELTAEQAHVAQLISSIRSLVRGQKGVIEEMSRLEGAGKETRKLKKSQQDILARNLAQQQLLFSALRDITGRQGLMMMEAKDSEAAMQRAIVALQEKDADEASKNQAEALALLQNCLLSLTEQMRRALTAKAP